MKSFRDAALSRLQENTREWMKQGKGTGAGFFIAQGRMTIDLNDWAEALSAPAPRGLLEESDYTVASNIHGQSDVPSMSVEGYGPKLLKVMEKWIKGRHTNWEATILMATEKEIIFDWEWNPDKPHKNPDEVVSEAVRDKLNLALDSILGSTAAERSNEVKMKGITYEHGETREGLAKSDPANFKGSSMEARVRDALNIASDTQGVENKHSVQIFDDYINDYFGYDAEFSKNRSKKGFFDGFLIQGRMTFDAKTSLMNPGNLDDTIREHFEKVFGSDKKPNAMLVKHIQNYISKKGLDKDVMDLFSDSDNPVDAMPKFGVEIILDNFDKAKNFKRIYKKKQKDEKKKAKSKSRPKKRVYKPRNKVTRAKASSKGKETKNARPKAPTAVSIIEMLNAALPEEILSRMQAPALVNRTGRFRNSAKVTNIVVGPKGGTSIEYTYMKNPYQTFEPGFRQGSTYRDPRRIIGQSIRELAKEIMGKKFVKTRRV